jgi:hypothetical protein
VTAETGYDNVRPHTLEAPPSLVRSNQPEPKTEEFGARMRKQISFDGPDPAIGRIAGKPEMSDQLKTMPADYNRKTTSGSRAMAAGGDYAPLPRAALHASPEAVVVPIQQKVAGSGRREEVEFGTRIPEPLPVPGDQQPDFSIRNEAQAGR